MGHAAATVFGVVENPAANGGHGKPGGRRFSGFRKVRLGDVSRSGRLRLDALTRYTQDVSDDDTTSAGLDIKPAWVVRRTSIEVMKAAELGEELEFVTYCSALGRSWAERRLEISGSLGARYDVVTLWICIDPVNGRPHTLTEQFRNLFAGSTGGRTVKARLTHPKPPADSESWVWPLRAADFDVFGHVNNAAYWAVVEQVLRDDPKPPFEVSIEYRTGLEQERSVRIVERVDEDGGWLLWLIGAENSVAASVSFRPGAPGRRPAHGRLERTDPSA